VPKAAIESFHFAGGETGILRALHFARIPSREQLLIYRFSQLQADAVDLRE